MIPLIDQISNDWKQFGSRLGYKPYILDNIQSDTRLHCNIDYARAVYEMWSKMAGTITKKKFSKIVDAIEAMGRMDVYGQIKRNERLAKFVLPRVTFVREKNVVSSEYGEVDPPVFAKPVKLSRSKRLAATFDAPRGFGVNRVVSAFDLMLVAQKIHCNPNELGLFLGLSSDFVSNVRNQRLGHHTSELIFDLLNEWRQEKGNTATREALSTVILAVGVKDEELAEKVKMGNLDYN
jgi:hypothetical protein